MPEPITLERSRSEYDVLPFLDVCIVDGAQSSGSQSPVNSSISFHIFSQDFFIREDSHWQEKTFQEFLYYSDITARCRDTGCTQ